MSTTTTAMRPHQHLGMRDRMHVPRSRGAMSGLLLLLLGIWGGLVPFAGPAFGYAYTPDVAWHFTWGRCWLEILPGAATALGGLWLVGTTNRVSGAIGGWLAVAGGAWFVVGQSVSRLWNDGVPAVGSPTATTTAGQLAEELGFFTALGTVIVLLAAFAIGRLSVIGVRDVQQARDWYDDLEGEEQEPVATVAPSHLLRAPDEEPTTTRW